MAENIELFDYDFYLNYDKVNQSFSPTACTEDDLKRAQQVGLDVFLYEKKYEAVREKTNLNVLLSKALYQMDCIGCIANMNETISLLNSLEYYYDDGDPSLFSTISEIEKTKTGSIKKAKYIVVPMVFNSSSCFFMSHEISHILKERNPKECKNVYTLQEVIPMLIELILSFLSNERYTFQSLVNDRMKILSLEAKRYFEIRNEMDYTIEKDKKNALRIGMLLSSVYLNSFYYSLVLFQMYLCHPSFIKELIASVLNLEITTDEMIEIVLQEKRPESVQESYQKGMRMIKSL